MTTSIGISLATTLLTRRSDTHQSDLTNYMPQSGAAYQNGLHSAQQALNNTFGQATSFFAAQSLLYQQLERQALNWAFVDVFRWLSLLCLLCVVLVWFLKKVKPGKAPEGVH